MAVTVILERRASRHPWGQALWRVDAVRPAGDDVPGWRCLETGADRSRWSFAGVALDLFRSDVDGYRENLAGSAPKVFVVLRTDTETDPRVRVFLITACPFEAQAYLDSGEDTVEGVAMADELRMVVQAFVDRQPPPQSFRKRKRTSNETGPEAEPFWRPPPVTSRGR